MSEKYKLFLTRNRLFDFEGCVSLTANYCGELDSVELNKALKMLSVKEPLITSTVSLAENSDAFVDVNTVEQHFSESGADAVSEILHQQQSGFDFTKELFRFVIIGKSTIGIFAHRAVADVKALLFLMQELIEFYEKRSVLIEPLPIRLFSEKTDVPGCARSPIIDRVSTEMDQKWSGHSREFSAEDYINAKGKYMSASGGRGFAEIDFTNEETAAISARCAELKADVSVAAAYALKTALIKRFGGKKNYNKINAECDMRLYFDVPEDYRVGPFSGAVAIMNPKEKLADSLRAFQKEYYKKATSPFQAFYNDVFLMNVSPSLCDASYMYAAGSFKNKAAKRLAENYGCKANTILDYCFYNFDQSFWRGLSGLSDINAFEAFRINGSFLCSSSLSGERLSIKLLYRTDICKENDAKDVLSETAALLSTLK